MQDQDEVDLLGSSMAVTWQQPSYAACIPSPSQLSQLLNGTYGIASCRYNKVGLQVVFHPHTAAKWLFCLRKGSLCWIHPLHLPANNPSMARLKSSIPNFPRRHHISVWNSGWLATVTKFAKR